MQLAFKRFSRVDAGIRGVNTRRISAAKRALKNQREKLPLLADLIAEQQPTPEQRIKAADLRCIRIHQRFRDSRAQEWKAARKSLLSMEPAKRALLVNYWNRSKYPKDPNYLNGLIARWLKGWRPKVLTEADFVMFEEGRKKVDELLTRWKREGKYNV